MIVVIPTVEEPFYNISVNLEGRVYTFEFRYNQREDRWYFNVLLPDGTHLVDGVKVMCGFDLLRPVADVRLPPGILLAQNTGTNNAPPGFAELGEGKRVTLLYLSTDELA